jgi:hypothetical protein
LSDICIPLSQHVDYHGNARCSDRDARGGAVAVEHSDQDRVGEEAAVEQSDEDRGDDQDRRDVQILEKLLTQTLLLKWQQIVNTSNNNLFSFLTSSWFA